MSDEEYGVYTAADFDIMWDPELAMSTASFKDGEPNPSWEILLDQEEVLRIGVENYVDARLDGLAVTNILNNSWFLNISKTDIFLLVIFPSLLLFSPGSIRINMRWISMFITTTLLMTRRATAKYIEAITNE